MKTDFYEILGVQRNALLPEIQAAYRGLAKALHPDVNPNGAALMQQVNEAYGVLANAKSRAKYDRGEWGLPPKITAMPNPMITGTIDLTKLAQAFIPAHVYQAAGPSLERALSDRGISPKAARVEQLLESFGFLKKRGRKSA